MAKTPAQNLFSSFFIERDQSFQSILNLNRSVIGRATKATSFLLQSLLCINVYMCLIVGGLTV